MGRSLQDSKVQGMKLLAAFLLHLEIAQGLQSTMVDVFTDSLQHDGELTKEQGTTKADKALLRLTAGSCILRLTKNKSALCSADAFATAARLCEDEDLRTKTQFMFKVYKGTARQAGKLPFQFASMLALVAHDAEPAVVEKGRFYLRNVLALMLKLRKQAAKAPVSLLHERMLPYLLFGLAVHPAYLDPEDSSSQVGLSLTLAFFLFLPLSSLPLLSLLSIARSDAGPEDGARRSALPLRSTSTSTSPRSLPSRLRSSTALPSSRSAAPLQWRLSHAEGNEE